MFPLFVGIYHLLDEAPLALEGLPAFCRFARVQMVSEVPHHCGRPTLLVTTVLAQVSVAETLSGYSTAFYDVAESGSCGDTGLKKVRRIVRAVL